MKKFLCLILALSVSLVLFGCKSRAAKDVEKQIAALGQITIESGDAIDAAKEALNALSPEQQAYVSNANILAMARLDYQELMYEQQARELEKVIHDLRPITLKSDEQLAAADKIYNDADINVKLKVDNFEDMVYSFELYDFIRIDRIEAMIAAIGRVAPESGPVIEAARKAYDAADPEIQSRVYKLYSLLEAEKQFEAIQKSIVK